MIQTNVRGQRGAALVVGLILLVVITVLAISGIHGWYLRNDDERPIVVRLKVAGFYELLEQ
jgi:Tfp pilus assembly protein PilX